MTERSTPPAANDDATLRKPPGNGSSSSQPPAPNPHDETLRPNPSAPPPSAPADGNDETLVKPRPSEVDTHQQTLHVADRAAAARRAAAFTNAADTAGESQVKPFGDYDLLSVIAKGGMGVVYKARQRKLNRVVAIKMILAGQFADSTDVERFYAEAEAAANLRHRNIVGIYEIGEVDGQHFFSMEYIEGESLSGLVRTSPLDPRQAAKYTRTIAEAMQFAHERGILHRDLKPSNVLIDGEGEPLITDFGLAKKVESQSQLTMTGTIVGTPSYMPPEQAKGDIERIDARSDVYSTGAILYELITGVPPFRAANPFETIRQVLTVEPAAPCVVNPSIPKDLETICLKSLQKDPAARYGSEKELLDELSRFLNGEPILARPIGLVARTWRWCRRNPIIASLSAAVFLALVIGLIGTTVGLVQARIAMGVAEQKFQQARGTVDNLFTRVSEDTLLNTPGMQPLRQSLLMTALEYYLQFAEERKDDPSVRQELANTFYRIGYITGEIESQKAAIPWYDNALAIQLEMAKSTPSIELLNDLGDTWNGLGVARQKTGAVRPAEEAYTSAIATRRQVVDKEPTNAENRRELANSLMNMGLLLRESKEFEEARRYMLDAQEIRADQLAKDDSNAPLRRDFAQGYYNLARLEWDMNDLDAADKNFELAEDRFSELLTDAPKDLWNQWRLGTCLRARADVNAKQFERDVANLNPDEAVARRTQVFERYERARKLTAKLALRNPDVVDYQGALARLFMNRGSFQQSLESDSDALESFEIAMELLRSIIAENVRVTEFRRDLAVTQTEYAMELAMTANLNEAAAQASQATELFSELATELKNPDNMFKAQRKRAEEVRDWIAEVEAARAP